MRLFLLRHGETAHNAGQVALGRQDVPLNETGLSQAEAAGEYLAGKPIVAIYSSPLQRATASSDTVRSLRPRAISATRRAHPSATTRSGRPTPWPGARLTDILGKSSSHIGTYLM